MKRYKIELTEEQMHLIALCLEDVSRFASGQMELGHTVSGMLEEFPFEERRKRKGETEELLTQVKGVLLTEEDSNKGYNGSDFIGNTYQIYRNILHQLAIDNEWNNVYSFPALPSGNLGAIKIELINDFTLKH